MLNFFLDSVLDFQYEVILGPLMHTETEEEGLEASSSAEENNLDGSIRKIMMLIYV